MYIQATTVKKLALLWGKAQVIFTNKVTYSEADLYDIQQPYGDL